MEWNGRRHTEKETHKVVLADSPQLPQTFGLHEEALQADHHDAGQDALNRVVHRKWLAIGRGSNRGPRKSITMRITELENTVYSC